MNNKHLQATMRASSASQRLPAQLQPPAGDSYCPPSKRCWNPASKSNVSPAVNKTLVMQIYLARCKSCSQDWTDLPGALRMTRAQKERCCSEDRKPRERELGRIQNQRQCELCDVSAEEQVHAPHVSGSRQKTSRNTGSKQQTRGREGDETSSRATTISENIPGGLLDVQPVLHDRVEEDEPGLQDRCQKGQLDALETELSGVR